MCIRNRGDDLGAAVDNSVIKHPIRRTRTKTRRPKFVSLRLELISPQNCHTSSTLMSPKKHVHGGRHHHRHQPPPPPQQQLNLFPLHPENLVESMHDENVAFIFNNDVGSSCCSLQSFLPNNYQNGISVSSEEDSLNFAYSEEGGVGGGRSEADGSSLVRTAMRSRERKGMEEEKWVCYSEVVEKKEASWEDHQVVEELEVTSSAADQWLKKKLQNRKQLSLKLDYQGILNAWSDKAPLFIKGESPQTVPNLHDDQTLRSDSLPNRVMDGMGSEGNVWKVPEMGGVKKEDNLVEAKIEGWKMGQREASVLRYKEKRQSRLFSKRIRYQVRKLNAEKRPRMKGRFVKRS